jgi:hypothetical protein
MTLGQVEVLGASLAAGLLAQRTPHDVPRRRAWSGDNSPAGLSGQPRTSTSTSTEAGEGVEDLDAFPFPVSGDSTGQAEVRTNANPFLSHLSAPTLLTSCSGKEVASRNIGLGTGAITWPFALSLLAALRCSPHQGKDGKEAAVEALVQRLLRVQLHGAAAAGAAGTAAAAAAVAAMAAGRLTASLSTVSLTDEALMSVGTTDAHRAALTWWNDDPIIHRYVLSRGTAKELPWLIL